MIEENPTVSSLSDPEAGTRRKLRRLWQMGDLFHVTKRYPHKRHVPPTDRLAGILRRGIVAPGACAEGLVSSDLNIIAEGLAEPYDRLVFLHQFGEQSYIYTISMPGMFTVFIDPALPVITQADMGKKWVVLCRDEVYVRERVAPEHLMALAVHADDADAVLAEFLPDLQRLQIPLYVQHGNLVWPGE